MCTFRYVYTYVYERVSYISARQTHCNQIHNLLIHVFLHVDIEPICRIGFGVKPTRQRLRVYIHIVFYIYIYCVCANKYRYMYKRYVEGYMHTYVTVCICTSRRLYSHVCISYIYCVCTSI